VRHKWYNTARPHVKHAVGDSQNTTNYLFATAGVQDSNSYMFRPFLLTIIRLYIPSFNTMYNKLTERSDDAISITPTHSTQYRYYVVLQYI
jgi:hypothetical protein